MYVRTCTRTCLSRTVKRFCRFLARFACHPPHFRGRYPVLHYFNTLRMLFLSRAAKDRDTNWRACLACWCRRNSYGEFDDFVKCPGASSTVTRQLWVRFRAKFRFLGAAVRWKRTGVRGVRVCVCRKFAMRQKLSSCPTRDAPGRKFGNVLISSSVSRLTAFLSRLSSPLYL